MFEKLQRELDGKYVAVGWLESAKYEDGTQVAYVATIQENGAPAVGIPPRPFMQPTINEHRDEWRDLALKGMKAVAQGRIDADQMLDQLGGLAAGQTKETIENVTSPKLSDVTLLLRKWRREGMTITGSTVAEARRQVASGNYDISGVNSDPLTDTGLMIATLTHWVDKE